MRGMYTAGVLDTFMDHGIKADLMCGVSAGALFGVNFLSGQKGRAIRYNCRFNRDRRYMGVIPLIKEGNFASTQYAYCDVPRVLDPFDNETYMQSGVPFYAVVTDTVTGEPAYIHVKSVFEQMDALRASGSMPFVSRPVEISGHTYLDGGISDSIPFEWALSQGADKMIAVLTRPDGFAETPMNHAVLKMYGLKYPMLAKRLAARHTDYNAARAKLIELEARGKAVVIRPSRPIGINRIERDPEKLKSAHALGVKDALDRMEEIKKYLSI